MTVRERLQANGTKLVLLAILAIWAWISLPWITGERILVLRDVMYTHRHFKAFGAEQLREGRIPAINPTWGLGQPFRGNPNALPFYPGNVLYVALPFETAFHLHFALHWLLAFLAMRKLARELGQSAEASLLAGVAWSGSGFVLSLLSFYNLLAVAAWAPLVLWGLARGGRRGVALGGLACGMMLLGGEPLSAALVVVPMALVAFERHGARRGTTTLFATGVLGLLVSLPQLVAGARIAGFSFRAAHGLEEAEAGWQSLHPGRLLELLLPLPWGWPSDYARFGYWSKVVTPDIPYVYSIHFGIVAFALALAACRRRPRWGLLGAGALSIAWAAGAAPGLLVTLTGGLFRYPQKLAILFTLSFALLAGWGLDALRERPRAGRWVAGAGLLLLALAGVVWLRYADFIVLLRDRLAEGAKVSLAVTHGANWLVGLTLAGLLLLAAGWAIARRSSSALIALQIAGLLQLAPMFVSDTATFYRSRPPLLERLEPPMSVVPIPAHEPDWEPRLPYPVEVVNPAGQARVAWFQLEAPFGVPWGLSYPIAPDLEGLTTPLHVFVFRNLQLSPWEHRLPWLARLGVGWIVRFESDPLPGFERVAVERQFGLPIELLRVPSPAPPVAWPERVVFADNPVIAFASVASGGTAAGTAIASRPIAHVPGGVIEQVERSPDRWVVDVESGGGLMILQTAWHPIWKARLEDGTELATQPVEIALMGVEVPPGRQRVTLEVSAGPEIAAALVALAAILGALTLGYRRTE